jgi:hypothetical protein
VPLTQSVIILLGGVGMISYMVGDPSWGSYGKPAIIALTGSTIIVFLVIDKCIEKKFETVRA